MDVCDRCGCEGGGHTTWCYRETANRLAAQDCPPVVIDPNRDYGDPPF